MNMRPRDVSPGEHEECDSLPCDRELTNGNTPESRSHYSSSKTERFYLQGVGQPTTDRSTRGHSPAVSEPEPPPTTPETEPEPPSPPDLLGSEPLPNARGAPVLPTAPSESGVGQIGSLQTPVTPLIPGVSQSPTEPVLTRGENCDNSDTDNEDSDSEQDETGAIRNGYLSWMVRGDHSLPHAMAILIAETSEATSKLMRCDWKRFLVDVLCFESEIELQYARSRFPAAICHLVLERLTWAGLTAKASKCILFATSAPYLGHVISRSGLEMDPAKIEKIRDIDPKGINTLERVRSFVGLCSYYRRFVKGFAAITAPLADLTKIGVDVAEERGTDLEIGS